MNTAETNEAQQGSGTDDCRNFVHQQQASARHDGVFAHDQRIIHQNAGKVRHFERYLREGEA